MDRFPHIPCAFLTGLLATTLVALTGCLTTGNQDEARASFTADPIGGPDVLHIIIDLDAIDPAFQDQKFDTFREAALEALVASAYPGEVLFLEPDGVIPVGQPALWFALERWSADRSGVLVCEYTALLSRGENAFDLGSFAGSTGVPQLPDHEDRWANHRQAAKIALGRTLRAFDDYVDFE